MISSNSTLRRVINLLRKYDGPSDIPLTYPAIEAKVTQITWPENEKIYDVLSQSIEFGHQMHAEDYYSSNMVISHITESYSQEQQKYSEYERIECFSRVHFKTATENYYDFYELTIIEDLSIQFSENKFKAFPFDDVSEAYNLNNLYYTLCHRNHLYFSVFNFFPHLLFNSDK